MRSLIQAIVNGILQFVVGYIDRERRIIAEAQVKVEKGRLRSVVSTAKVEKRLRVSRPLRPSRTAVEWNKKAGRARLGTLTILLFLILSSCAPVIVESRWPIIPVPARPVLPLDPPGFSPREMILVDYTEELELRIEIFNEEAHEHNTENGY